jgi:hypothetical protein
MDLFRGPHKILLSQTDCSFVFDAAGETVTVVGDADPALMKYFDCTRTSIRSPFDDDVVFQFEYMEYVRLTPVISSSLFLIVCKICKCFIMRF